MPYRRKTWKEQLHDGKKFPKILKLEPKFPCYRALEKMGAKPEDSVVLAPPLDVDAVMRQVPKGQLITLRGICEQLATKHQTQYCCTLTTGIFVNIVANAAEEMQRDVPYWRTIKNDGQLNDKYPGGSKRQKQALEREGHTTITRGRKHIKYYVKAFEQSLVKT
jgi:alkylated DNA nucleotide flippase Atl1